MEDNLTKSKFTLYLAGFWSVFSAVYIGAVTFVPLSDSGTRIADTVLGFLLGTAIAGILQHFFKEKPNEHP